MIVSQNYVSNTSNTPLKIIFSDEGYYLYKEGQYYESVIIPQDISLDSYIETNIALPSKKISKEEVFDILFHNYVFTYEQIQDFYEKMLKHFNTGTDEECLCFHFLFPNWQAGQNYISGDKIKYNDNLYEILQNHTSNINLTPDLATGFYRKLKIQANQALEWEQKNYNAGDRVKYGNHIFESLINDNSWSPEIFVSGWRLIQ